MAPKGAERRCIGYETSEYLEYKPGTFHVVVEKHEQLACPKHEEGGVATAPPRPRPVPRGLVSAGLVAYVLLAKFGDHQPLHRMHRQFLRHGVDLAVSADSGSNAPSSPIQVAPAAPGWAAGM
jgi:transposase